MMRPGSFLLILNLSIKSVFESSKSRDIAAIFLKTQTQLIQVVVSNIFYFQPYLGKISNLTNIFQMG